MGILIGSFILLLALGKFLVPLEIVDHERNCVWPPLIHCLFTVAPLLLARYSRKKTVTAIGIAISLASLLVFVAPLVPFWSGLCGNALRTSGNPLCTWFSVLYIALLAGSLMFLMICGGSM